MSDLFTLLKFKSNTFFIKLQFSAQALLITISSGECMNLMKICLMFFIVVSALSSAAIADRDDTDITSGRDSDSRYAFVAPKGPCLSWFLFFCLRRGSPTGSYDANYEDSIVNDDRGKPMEPAMTNHLGSKGAPIMAPFLAAFNKCAPGCSYIDWGVWGDERHKRKRSCHNSGSAIDIHAIKCNGKTHRGGTGDAKFLAFRSCMHGKNGLYTIHGSGMHKEHIDIALASCQLRGVGKIQIYR